MPRCEGAVVELSMLFADVRGSSKLAREMSTLEFTRLMDRFYRVSSEVLVDHDAIIEKFVGDEVDGLFVPFLAGTSHASEHDQELRTRTIARTEPAASREIEAATAAIPASIRRGCGPPSSRIASSSSSELIIPMNIAAHLAAQAAAGGSSSPRRWSIAHRLREPNSKGGTSR
jgi:class 3 adenylate cyclase